MQTVNRHSPFAALTFRPVARENRGWRTGLKTTLLFDDDPGLGGINVGLVEATGIRWPQPAVFDPRFADIVRAIGTRGPEAIPASRKSAVRDMLRHGRYKPAGRAKPSSEYLLQSALESDFPAVNFFVDAVNVVSLVSGYPISIVDPGKAGFEFLLRRGRDGEQYVFNAGGQTIDLADLLCVCRKAGEGFVPTANPVRDSMATKLFPGADAAVAFIYAPAGAEKAGLESACMMLEAYLLESAGHVVRGVVSAKS